ncbi:MAG: sensor domain-containing diguanylate cyclase, partial [Magnetospirillum sp.]
MMIGSVNRAVIRTDELYVSPLAVNNAALEARLVTGQVRNAVVLAVLSRDQADVTAADDRIKVLEARLDAALATVEASPLGSLAEVREVRLILPRWSVLRQSIFARAAAGRFEEARGVVLGDGTALFTELAVKLQYVLDTARDRSTALAVEARAEEAASISGAWSILMIGGFIAFAIGLLVMRNVLWTIKHKDSERDRLNARLEESLSLTQAVIAGSTVGIGAYTADGDCILANDAFATITGGSAEQLLAQNFHAIPSWRDSGMATAALQVLESGRPSTLDVHIVTSFGRDIWIECRFSRFLRDNAPHLLAMVTDITERKTAEAETQLAASVFHNTVEGIIVTAADGTILSVNPGFSRITGYAAAEAIGQTPRLLKSDHHDRAFYQTLWRSITETGCWQGEIWNRRKGGEAYLEWLTITMISGPDGRPFRFVAVFDDITETRRKDERIRHLAFHDALTGLPNRLLLQDRLGHSIEIARRDVTQVAVMFIDLDRFKVVNDSLGHDVGDMLLVQVTERLVACLRKSDTVARQGGDEFVVVLSDFDAVGEVAEVAEKIIGALVEPVRLRDHEIHIGASIGIALFPQDGDDVTS